MEFTKLNNGIEMPLLGFGVYQIAPEDCRKMCYGCPKSRLSAD